MKPALLIALTLLTMTSAQAQSDAVFANVWTGLTAPATGANLANRGQIMHQIVVIAPAAVATVNGVQIRAEGSFDNVRFFPITRDVTTLTLTNGVASATERGHGLYPYVRVRALQASAGNPLTVYYTGGPTAIPPADASAGSPTNLTGDVTSVGAATTVASVAGKTAAAVAQSVTDSTAGVPTASTGAAVQAVIDSLPNGGTVRLKANTTYALGTTGLVVPAGVNDLNINFGKGASLTYTGTGTALTVGGYSAVTYRFSMTGHPYINLLNASGTSARGLLLTRIFIADLYDLRVESQTKGAACTGTAREAIRLDGGNSASPVHWSQSQSFYGPRISGDFKYGIVITQNTNSIDGNNANLIIGGTFGNTCAEDPAPAGFVGLLISVGDSNAVLNTDFESWNVGVHIFGHANRIMSLRTESNGTDWITAASAVGNYIHGGWLVKSDLGTNTSFVSGSNGGENVSQFSTPTLNGNTKVTGTLGFSPSAAAAADAFISRIGATSLLFAGESYFRAGFGVPSIRSTITGEASARWMVTGGGTHYWSNGTAAADNTLSRISATEMRFSQGLSFGTGTALISPAGVMSGFKFFVSTVALLPTCNAAAEGSFRGVTDAASPTFAATVAGGGSSHIPVYCDGTNWTVR